MNVGDIFRSELTKRGIGLTDAAGLLGVYAHTITNIVDNKLPEITAVGARKLARRAADVAAARSARMDEEQDFQPGIGSAHD